MSDLKEQFPDFFRLARRLESGNAEFGKGSSGDVEFGKNPITKAPLTDANVVTSRVKRFDDEEPNHQVVLDIDMDAALIPSSTPGHYHLMIDKMLPWEDYHYLLKALASVGIIQKGYYESSKIRKASVIRTPWTKKEK